MPPTLEAACTDADCPLDMVELHYTYELDLVATIDDFRCPCCGGRTLEKLYYTYEDSP